MSALARWFKAQGYHVGGYDKTETTLTRMLVAEGMDIHYDAQSGRIPTEFYRKHETLVIHTPAVPQSHVEYQYFKGENYAIFKRSQVLGLITDNLITVAVAGTHGKTTTSSLIAHILKHSGANVSAFLGGITVNYNTNVLIGKPTPKIDTMQNVPIYGKHICVVEADEFDRSFLTLYPDIAVVTSMDADHLDIYGHHDELKKSFQDFINQIKVKGHLVIRKGLPYQLTTNKITYVYEYCIEGGNFSASNIRITHNKYIFDYKVANTEIKNIELSVPGYHNVENAVAAINACLLLEVPFELIKSGIESFRGVKRRFEYIINRPDMVYIDDYAHHPTEIEALLTSVRDLYPGKEITCVFQPHLFTRTRDFMEGFAKSLSIAHKVILLPIYPARELPISGISSEILLEKIPLDNKVLVEKDQLTAYLATQKPQLLLTVGAGDIDTCVEPIKNVFSNLNT